MDIGSLFRVFRNYIGTGVAGKNYAFGWGVNADFSYEVFRNVRYVLDLFGGEGSGRYIGGLVPDAIVLANGTIETIPAYSFVAGFQIAPNRATGFCLDFSGVYGQKEIAIDTNESLIGWRFPGASNKDHQAWRRGSKQLDEDSKA